MSSEDVDMLSKLPEEISSHILSLMPTKHAVRTSVLSKRWRYRWMFVTNLDFDDVDSNHSFTKLVDRVLEFCKSPQLQLFRLHTSGFVPMSSQLKWIDKAVSLNVREFDIQLYLSDLPLSLCTCTTLTKLILHRTRGDCTAWECWKSLYPVSLPCLKTLDIVVCKDPLVSAFKVIYGCPILENLSLEVKWGQNRRHKDYIFNIPTLKRLRLTVRCDLLNHKVVLNVPKLEYLFVGGDLSSLFVMEDVSSLAEATLSFAGLQFVYDHLWVELFKGLSGVKSFSAQILNSLICIPFISHLPIFPNMKHLELKHFGNPRFIPHILEMSPQLTCLSMEYVHADNYFEYGESYRMGPIAVPACMLTNLTTIKSKCMGQMCVVDILEYLLRNAAVLKTVTITWHNLCFEKEMRLGAQLLKVPRASPYCEIIFIASSSLSTASTEDFLLEP